VVVAITLSVVMLLATQEICSSGGLASAACFCALIFGFYSCTVGTFMTESAGLIMGVLALSALMRGFSRNDFWMSCAGVCTLALAVLTRAGALFAVPLVAIAILVGHHRSARESWRHALLVVVAALGYLGAVYLGARLVVPPGATFQGNFRTLCTGLPLAARAGRT